jgi:hypothetical protein
MQAHAKDVAQMIPMVSASCSFGGAVACKGTGVYKEWTQMVLNTHACVRPLTLCDQIHEQLASQMASQAIQGSIRSRFTRDHAETPASMQHFR